MTTQLNPYLNFKDNARQAMEFYKSVFGGELQMRTFKEYNASQNPAEDNKIMHAELDNKNGVAFMGSDTPDRMEYRPGTNITMSLSGENEMELTNFYNKLAAGGMVTQPLQKAIWGDTFGMLTDKYGISWLVNINAPR
jgi:PhnB protein